MPENGRPVKKSKKALAVEQRGRYGAPSRKELGERLRALRVAAGIPQAIDMADMLGMPRSTYSNYEYGIAAMNYAVIWDVCKILEITPDEFLGFDGCDTETFLERVSLAHAEDKDPREVFEKALMPNASEGDAMIAIGLISKTFLGRLSRAGKGA